MVYYDWASRGNTKLGLVLCLHGLTGNGRFFDKLADVLSDARCRVVCPDIVGRGKSGWLKRSRDYNMQRYFSHLEVLINHLKVSEITLIGTSTGDGSRPRSSFSLWYFLSNFNGISISCREIPSGKFSRREG